MLLPRAASLGPLGRIFYSQWGPGPPGPLLFSVFCFSKRPPPATPRRLGPPLIQRSKTLGRPRFSLQPSCHLVVVPLSSFFLLLSLLPLSRRSRLPRPVSCVALRCKHPKAFFSICSSYVHSRRRTADGVCDEERSERGIRVIRSLPPKRKSTATHRAHASIHLASRRSGSARLLRSTRGPVLLAQRGRCGTHRRSGSLLNANSVEQEVRCVCV